MNTQDLLFQFEKYLDDLEFKTSSRNSKKRNLTQFLNWLDDQNLDCLVVEYNDVIAYINFCKANSNINRTINHKLKSIEQFYQLLEQQHKVTVNPFDGVQLKGVTRRLPHNILEINELIDTYNKYPNSDALGKRNKTILSLIVYQGVGAGEITKLRVQDIKLETGKIYLPKVARANSRTIDLKAHQILQLQQYITTVRPYLLSLANKESEQLFISKGKSITGVLSRLIINIRKYNPNVTGIKQIRASLITHWLNIHNIRQVQYMAGHRYVSSTERYKVDKLESLQEQIELLHPLK